jgi:ATP-dependent DNA ligase
VHLTPITTDPALARRWFEIFEGAGLDGLIAKDGAETYQPNKRVMAKVKHVRTADCVVAGYRPHKSGPDAVGSLLLGLYDDPADPIVPAAMREWTSDETGLTPVGVIGAFPMAVRKELVTELEPLVTTFEGHPWNWAGAASAAAAGGNYGSRWNPRKDLTFVPLRPERVVEVRYEHMEGHRFRHMAQFQRWRPDRDPRSCGFGQLDQPVLFDLGRILDGQVDVG